MPSGITLMAEYIRSTFELTSATLELTSATLELTSDIALVSDEILAITVLDNPKQAHL